MARSRRVVAGAALAGALLTGALLAGCDRRGDTAAAKGVSPGVPVTVADVVTRDVPVQIRAIGNVQPLATVSVLSMINGEVMKVHFGEGQEVPAVRCSSPSTRARSRRHCCRPRPRSRSTRRW